MADEIDDIFDDIFDEDEEKEEVVDIELQELVLEAMALEINPENKSKEQLRNEIEIMKRVKAQGLQRLKFQETDEPGKKTLIRDDPLNIEILSRPAEEGDLERLQVIDKLKGYRLLDDKNNTTNRRWIRYINVNDGKLRTGGFPIKNEAEYIVLKNVSKKITLSIRKDDVIIFEKVPSGILPENIQNLFDNISGTGNIYVIISPDLQFIYTGRTINEVAINSNINRNSVSRAIRGNRGIIKKHYLFKMTNDELENVRTSLENVDLGDGVDSRVLEVINRFY